MLALFFAVIAGAIGMAYLAYGKKQSKFVFIIFGILLCVYPYFIQTAVWTGIDGIILTIIPLVLNHYNLFDV